MAGCCMLMAPLSHPCRPPDDRVTDAPRLRRSALDRVVLEDRLADDHLLDLGGALTDEQHRGLPVEALDLVLLGVAEAAVDAEGLLDDVGAVLGGEVL